MAVLRHIEEENYIKLYDPDGNYLGMTNNELEFNDFRLQIIEENKEGYYFIKDHKKVFIKATGRIENGNDNYPFNLYTNQLARILTDGIKNLN